MPSDPCYDVGDRLLLHSDHSPPVEVTYRGCDADGRAVVVLNGFQLAVDPQRLSAQSPPDDEEDL